MIRTIQQRVLDEARKLALQFGHLPAPRHEDGGLSSDHLIVFAAIKPLVDAALELMKEEQPLDRPDIPTAVLELPIYDGLDWLVDDGRLDPNTWRKLSKKLMLRPSPAPADSGQIIIPLDTYWYDQKGKHHQHTRELATLADLLEEVKRPIPSLAVATDAECLLPRQHTIGAATVRHIRRAFGLPPHVPGDRR